MSIISAQMSTDVEDKDVTARELNPQMEAWDLVKSESVGSDSQITSGLSEVQQHHHPHCSLIPPSHLHKEVGREHTALDHNCLLKI